MTNPNNNDTLETTSYKEVTEKTYQMTANERLAILKLLGFEASEEKDYGNIPLGVILELAKGNVSEGKLSKKLENKAWELLGEKANNTAKTTNNLVRLLIEAIEKSKVNKPNTDPKGYLKILGINPETLAEMNQSEATDYINSLQRFAAKRKHPDTNGGKDEAMKNINEAAEHLNDEEERKAYLNT